MLHADPATLVLFKLLAQWSSQIQLMHRPQCCRVESRAWPFLILFCNSDPGFRRSELEPDGHAQGPGQQGQLEGVAEPEAEEEVLRQHLHDQRSRDPRDLRKLRWRRRRTPGVTFHRRFGGHECTDLTLGVPEDGPEVGGDDGAIYRQKINALAFPSVSFCF